MKHFGAWLRKMLDAAPTYISTATPIALLGLNALLASLGERHADVGTGATLVAAAILAGNFLRRGFESGQFVKQAAAIDAEYAQLATPPFVPAAPAGFKEAPVAPTGVIGTLVQPPFLVDQMPPGAPVQRDANIFQDADGTFFARQGDSYVKVVVHHVA